MLHLLNVKLDIYLYKHKETQTDRQTEWNTKTHRQTDTQSETQEKHIQTEWNIKRLKDRQTDRQSETQRHTDRQNWTHYHAAFAVVKIKHTSTWLHIMWKLSDIITISFCLNLHSIITISFNLYLQWTACTDTKQTDVYTITCRRHKQQRHTDRQSETQRHTE